MCDETASSRIAPTPILPIRDVKVEAGSPCDVPPPDGAPVIVSPIDVRAPASPVMSSDAAFIDVWSQPTETKVGAPLILGYVIWSSECAAKTPGFASGVFRPPRG